MLVRRAARSSAPGTGVLAPDGALGTGKLFMVCSIHRMPDRCKQFDTARAGVSFACGALMNGIKGPLAL